LSDRTAVSVAPVRGQVVGAGGESPPPVVRPAEEGVAGADLDDQVPDDAGAPGGSHDERAFLDSVERN
jgi:hypothetical protein